MSANPTPYCDECGAAIPSGEKAFMRGIAILCQNCWSKEPPTPAGVPVLRCPLCYTEMMKTSVWSHGTFVRFLFFIIGLSSSLIGIWALVGISFVVRVVVYLFIFPAGAPRLLRMAPLMPLAIGLVAGICGYFLWREAFRKKKVHRCPACEYTVRAE